MGFREENPRFSYNRRLRVGAVLASAAVLVVTAVEIHTNGSNHKQDAIVLQIPDPRLPHEVFTVGDETTLGPAKTIDDVVEKIMASNPTADRAALRDLLVRENIDFQKKHPDGSPIDPNKVREDEPFPLPADFNGGHLALP